MKKIYEAPRAEFEKFTLECDICTVSQNTGIGDGGEGTTMPDDF